MGFQFDSSLIPKAYHATERTLRPQWRILCEQLGIKLHKTAYIYTQLTQYYTGSTRFYHDLQHVADLLATVDELQEECEDETAVRTAIWFHDIIYDSSGTRDSELLSAECAVAALAEWGISADFQQKVYTLILDTKHQQKPNSQDGCVVVDADLSTFAVSREKFNQHSADVRREFQHVPPDLYCSSRIVLLENMLAREHLYYTKTMRRLHETDARANLKHAIGQLKRGDLTFTT